MPGLRGLRHPQHHPESPGQARTGREKIVFISGIGCSSRFPYYMDTYGFHSIHGRAPAIATGLALAREDLTVWVVTGDGDALSIGGNHLIHALRRNVNMTILLFNNRIYGLTKGQYSPTSEVGKVTKSTPMGSLDHPFNPVSLALGAEATFVGRALDSDRNGLTEVLRGAAQHRGAAVVEILQDCPIFNDGSFDALRKEGAEERVINVRHGEPIVFGPNGEYCVVKSGFSLEVAKTADVLLKRSSCTTRTPTTRPMRSRCPGCPIRTSTTPCWEPSATSADPPTTTRPGPRSAPPRHRPRPTPLRCNRYCADATPGPSTEVAPLVPDAVSLAGVVLAGGESRRMGRDKASLPFPAHFGPAGSPGAPAHHNGRVCGGHCRAALRAGFRVAAPGNRCLRCKLASCATSYEGWGRCRRPGAGSRRRGGGCPLAFVCAVDMPFLAVELIDDLARRAVETERRVCCRGTATTTTSPRYTGPIWPTGSMRC